MVQGIRIPRGYHGNELGMYQELLVTDSARHPEYYPQGVEVGSPQLWRHENVQYWYTGADEATMSQVATQLKLPAFTKLAGPVRNAAGSMVYAYRIPVDNPAAWTTTAIVKAPPDQALGTLLDPRFDPASVAFVDTSAAQIQGAQLTALPAPSSARVAVTSYAPGAIDLTVTEPSTGQPSGQGALGALGALVVSENYFPGWRATVDGKPAPLARTDFNLIGVALPAAAGASRTIHLQFDDTAYQKGKIVTLVALAVALLMWFIGSALDRRRATAAVPAAA
jgi:hypothetical protein